MKNANIRHMLLALVLACGFAAFWSVVGVWAAGVVGYALGTDGGESLLVLSNGRAMIAREEGSKTRYFDLDGEPVADTDVGQPVRFTSYVPGVPDKSAAGRAPWSERVAFFSDWRAPATFWYFVKDGTPDGAGWFEGYDSERKTRVGYLGVGGFRHEKPEGDDCFRATAGLGLYALGNQSPNRDHEYHNIQAYAPSDGSAFAPWEVHVCVPGDRIYAVDLRTHQVRIVFQDDRMGMATYMTEDPFHPKGTVARLAVRLGDAIALFDRGGKEVLRYPIAPWSRGRTSHLEQVAPQEIVLRAHEPGSSPGEWRHRVCWSSPGGFREAEVVLRQNQRGLVRMAGLVVPSPLFGSGVLYYTSVKPIRGIREMSVTEAWAWSLAEYWPAVACASLIGVILAGLCYLRQRRYGATAGECVGWALFVLVLGLPGYVGYRFCRSWPVLERCGDCCRVVPRDAEACRACDTEFAAPARLGTEVFA